MSHNIPKIQYGSPPTEIVFDYPPPFSKDGPEEFDSVEHTVYSISGVPQTSIDRIEVMRSITFSFVSETLKSQLDTFFTTFAYLGKEFKYFDDQNSVSYVSYRLKDLKHKPKKIAIAGANLYVYDVPFTFRRVIGGSQNGDAMLASILNNQVAPINVAGLVFDKTSFQSLKIFFEIQRSTSLSTVISNGYLTATYHSDTDTWDITPHGTYDGDDHGVTFSMSGQQVQYASSNILGTNYSGQIKIKNFYPG